MWSHVAIALITFVAASVNGAVGYGFSSITVPFALMLVTSRTLNPAIVLVEVMLNAYVLWDNRTGLGAVRRRTSWMIAGLVPGVVAGAFLIARIDADRVKLGVLLMLLPLLLLQAAGYRRPIPSERAVEVPFGAAIGVLYSVTTISGPPLAAFLNNQSMTRREFRAAMASVRLAESLLTAATYGLLGLYGSETLRAAAAIVPSLILGLPAGAYLIRKLDPEAFRRVCMSFDAGIVTFAISTLLRRMSIVAAGAAYTLLVVLLALDAVVLCRYFKAGASPRRQRDATVGDNGQRYRWQYGSRSHAAP